MPSPRAGWTTDALVDLADGPAALAEIRDQVDASIGAVACTSAARPVVGANIPVLYAGFLAFETDTGNLIRYNGTSWVVVADAATDSGWQTITVSGGYAARVGHDPQVRKIGTRVFVRGGWSNTGLDAGVSEAVGVIPVGYRPTSRQVFFPGVGSTGNQYAMFDITTGGTVTIRVGTNVPDYVMFPGELSGWLLT